MNESNAGEGEIGTIRPIDRIPIASIPDGGAVGARLPSSTGGFDIVIVRLGDRVHGYHNECPHAFRRLDWAPGKFLIDQGHIVCAAHGAMFTLNSGFCVSGPCRGHGLVPIALRIENDAIVLGHD